MAGREELYLKHIDENTGRIAKVLEKVLAKIEHYESKDEHDDKDYFACRGCAKIFTREYVKKEGMICPDCHLALVPLRTVERGD